MPKLKIDLVVDDKGRTVITGFGREVDKVMFSARAEVSKFGRELGVAAAGVAAIGVPLGLLAGNTIGVSAEFERLEASLDTITKGQGAEWFEKLNKWALKMPVNTGEAIKMFQQLRAMGLKIDLPDMTTLVDAASTLGGDSGTLKGIARALGQIVTKGKVSAEELIQLAERGIPAYEILREKLGLTSAELGNIGKSGIDANKAVQALLEGMKERYGGMSAKLQGMWDGQTEALRSYAKEFQRLFMDAGPMEALEAELADIIKALDELEKSGELKEWAEGAAKALTATADAAVHLGRIMIAGGSIYAALTYGPVLWGALRAAIYAVRLQYAIFTTFAASNGVWAAMTTSIGGATLQVKTFGAAMKTAGAVAFAAFAGWEIGSWLYDNFETARLAGLALVDGLLKGWIYVKIGAKGAFEAIAFAWTGTIADLKKKMSDWLIKSANVMKRMGMEETGLALEEYARSLDISTQKVDEHFEVLYNLKSELKGNLKAHEEIIDELWKESVEYGKATNEINKNSDAAQKNTNATNKSGQAARQTAADWAKANKDLADFGKKFITELPPWMNGKDVLTKNILNTSDIASPLKDLEKQKEAASRLATAYHDIYRELSKSSGAMSQKNYEAQVTAMNKQLAAYRKMGINEDVLRRLRLSREKEMYIEWAGNSQSFFDGFNAAALDAENKLTTLGAVGGVIFNDLADAASNTLVAGMREDFDGIGDMWNNVLDKMLQQLLAFVAKAAVLDIAHAVFGVGKGGNLSGIADGLYKAFSGGSGGGGGGGGGGYLSTGVGLAKLAYEKYAGESVGTTVYNYAAEKIGLKTAETVATKVAAEKTAEVVASKAAGVAAEKTAEVVAAKTVSGVAAEKTAEVVATKAAESVATKVAAEKAAEVVASKAAAGAAGEAAGAAGGSAGGGAGAGAGGSALGSAATTVGAAAAVMAVMYYAPKIVDWALGGEKVPDYYQQLNKAGVTPDAFSGVSSDTFTKAELPSQPTNVEAMFDPISNILTLLGEKVEGVALEQQARFDIYNEELGTWTEISHDWKDQFDTLRLTMTDGMAAASIEAQTGIKGLADEILTTAHAIDGAGLRMDTGLDRARDAMESMGVSGGYLTHSIELIEQAMTSADGSTAALTTYLSDYGLTADHINTVMLALGDTTNSVGQKLVGLGAGMASLPGTAAAALNSQVGLPPATVMPTVPPPITSTAYVPPALQAALNRAHQIGGVSDAPPPQLASVAYVPPELRGISQVKYHATGGIATRPMHVFGEAGHEAFLPLSSPDIIDRTFSGVDYVANAINRIYEAVGAKGQQREPAPSGPSALHAHLYLDGEQVAESVMPMVDDFVTEKNITGNMDTKVLPRRV